MPVYIKIAKYIYKIAMYNHNLIAILNKTQNFESNTHVVVHAHHSTYGYSLKYFLNTSLTRLLRSKAKMHENWT